MSLFKKNTRKKKPEVAKQAQADLSTILSSITFRLEQLERKVEALEGFFHHVIRARASAPLKVPENVNEPSKPHKRQLPVARWITRGKTIRPLRDEQ